MAHSPLLFEEDDDETTDTPLTSNELNNESSMIELNISEEKTEEDKLVENLRTILMGVPPPPAVTVSQYDASEILQCLNPENYENFQWNFTKGDLSIREEKNSTAVTGEWPLVRDLYWFNVSFNRGSISEELALLVTKYQERYVGNETSSSVNSFFSRSPIRTASAKKRARRHAWGHSPGRRLSHLARRRHTFSSANLQQNACKSLPDKKKMILVDKRKSYVSKRSRNSASKSCGNLKTKLASQATVSSSKRALFQSPENEKKNFMLNKRSVLSDKSKSSSCSKSVQRSKRALWPDAPTLKPEIEKDKENGDSCNVNVNGKRTAEIKCDFYSSAKKKCLKTLTFSDEQNTCSKIMPTLIPENLSHTHKQKLLWAVSDALRNEGIKTEHKHCKVYMLELFKLCKDIWLKKCVRQKSSGSTSERMSQLANRFCGEVVKKVKLKLEELENIVNNRFSPKKNYQNCTTEQSSFVDSTKDMKSSDNCNVRTVTNLVNSKEKNFDVPQNDSDCVQMFDNSNPESFKCSDKLSTSNDVNLCSKNKLNLLISECKSKNLAGESSGNEEKNNVSSKLMSDDVCRSESRTLLNEKVFRYTLIDDNVSKKNVTNFKNSCFERYNTELYIDGFRNVSLQGVSLDCNNENSVVSNLVDEKEFSPCPSLTHDEDTRGSSSCDVDLSKIIDMIDSSDHD